jgi:hypothetical protein
MEIYYEEEKYVAPQELKSTLKNLPMKYPVCGVGVPASTILPYWRRTSRRIARSRKRFSVFSCANRSVTTRGRLKSAPGWLNLSRKSEATPSGHLQGRAGQRPLVLCARHNGR